MKENIKIFPTASRLFEAAAADFTERANLCVKNKGCFYVALAGGNTAKFFFDSLIAYKTKIPWKQIHFFFGDERYVSKQDDANNFHMTQQHLFAKIEVPLENIHPIPTVLTDPKLTALAYEQELRLVFKIGNQELPMFDLTYLGLGEDAHTASLMPFSEVVKTFSENPTTQEKHQLVTALYVPELNMYRITLTPSVINNSSSIIFLIEGEKKATAVWEVLEGPKFPEKYPAQLIRSENGKTFWYLDKAAAKKLITRD